MQNEMPGSNDASSTHIPALDGVRGLAILMVLLWHYFQAAFPFFPGWAGVDLFFVLSGYLITGRLISTKDHPDYFARFYRNRALRILPLYYAVVIIFLAIIHFFVQKKNLPPLALYTGHWPSFLLFTQNWTFIYYGYPKDMSLLPLWSLAVEEQFYLIWPVLIFLISRNKPRTAVYIVLLVAILLIRTGYYLYYPASGQSIYYNTFFRMDALIAGSLLYLLHRFQKPIPATPVKWFALIILTTLVTGSLVTKNVSPYNPFFVTSGYSLLALLFACLIHLSIQPSPNLLNRWLTGNPLRFLGKISYGLYLVHVPILLMAGTKMFFLGVARWPDKAPLIGWISKFICLVISLLVSTLSYRYFESFFLRLKSSRSNLRDRSRVTDCLLSKKN